MARSRQSIATTSIRMVWPFLALAKKHGRDVDGYITRLGLTESQLEHPDTRVPTQAIVNLLREAIERSGMRDLGLLAARLVDVTHFGLGEYLARVRPTLRAALHDTARYLPLLSHGLELSVEPSEDRIVVRVWFRPELRIHEAVYEFIVAIAVIRARRMTGDASLSPDSIHFMHPRPADTSRHDALFCCPLHFGAEITHITLSASSLDARLPAAERALADLLASHADHLMEDLPEEDDLASRVARLLSGEVPLRATSVDSVAKRIGMSVRTLSRRLADEGTTYREVLDGVRKHTAMRELTEGHNAIAVLADRLGFANSQSFHRAFRRWTGTTAHTYRRETSKRRAYGDRRE